MKRRYIVFYSTSSGHGSTSIKVSRKERPVSVENIRAIEKILSEELNTDVAIVNYKYVGITWK